MAAAALGAVAMLLLPACRPAPPVADEPLRIGYTIEAPFAFVTPAGQPTGESIEIARHVASALGRRPIEWRQFEFAELIDQLRAEEIDVISAGLFITPERADLVAFSRPTCRVLEGLLVAAGNPHELHSYEDAVRRPEVRIAVLAGAVEQQVLQELGLPAARQVVVPDALTGLAAVRSGRADGLALSGPTIRWMAREGVLHGVAPAEPFRQSRETVRRGLGYAAFAFRPEDEALREEWDAVLARYLESAEHRALMARFGLVPGEAPGGVDAAVVLRLR